MADISVVGADWERGSEMQQVADMVAEKIEAVTQG